MNVLVLIADIIGSRNIDNRAEFQRALKRQLGTINQMSKSRLLSPYTLTLGDEFQAVYGAFDSLFVDIVRIIHDTHPIQLRFALSYGPLSTDINPDAALEMDGPAFNEARMLMNKMKSESTGIVQITAPELHNPDLVNVCLKLFGGTLSKQTYTNLTIVAGLMTGATTKELAQTLAITPRAVNKAIAKHSLDDLVELTQVLSREFTVGLQVNPGEEDHQ